MIDRELARQIGCVVNRIVEIANMKLKGGLTIHFDGTGFIGQSFGENFISWRDRFSSEKRGIPIEEDEFIRILTER